MMLSKNLIKEMEEFAKSIPSRRTKFTPEELECVRYLRDKKVSRIDTAKFMEKHFGKKYSIQCVKNIRFSLREEER